MKIFGIILGLVCSFQAVIAFEGFYVGGELGGAITEGKESGESLGIYDFRGYVPIDFTQKLADGSLQGNLYAGYGAQFYSLYLGGEIFAQFNSCELKARTSGGFTDGFPENNTNHSSSHLKVSSVQYGFDFRPGWIMTPFTLLYGRIGVGRAQLSSKTDDSFFVIEGADVGTLPLELSAHRTRATLRLGGGVEYHLTPHLTMRADYTFTDYGSIAVEGRASGLTSEGTSFTLDDHRRVKHLQQHALMLGLSYYFSDLCLDCRPLCCENPLFCGCYLGGALGGFYAEEKQRGETRGNFPTLFNNFTMVASSPPHLTNKGFEGGLFLGYGRQWRRLFLATEIFGEGYARHSLKSTVLSSFTNISNGNEQTLSLKTQLSVKPVQGGIDLRSGLFLTPFTLLYGRVGTSIASIKAHSQANFQGDLPEFSQFWNFTDKHSKQSTRATLRLGAGFEQALSDRLHLRLDYCFTDYGRIKLKGSTSSLSALLTPVFLNDFSSQHLFNHSVLLGLCYYFQ